MNAIPFKNFDQVSYINEKGIKRFGEVRGSREGKMIVLHKAGYSELIEAERLTKVTPAFEKVAYINERGIKRIGEMLGFRDGKAVVLHRAGYSELVEKDRLVKI